MQMTNHPLDDISLHVTSTNTPDAGKTSANDRMIQCISNIAWAESLSITNKQHQILDRLIVPLTQHDKNTLESLPIYFVHEVGGTLSMYFDIVRTLGPQQPSFGIQATSGMRTVEYAKSISIESRVEQYVGELIRLSRT